MKVRYKDKKITSRLLNTCLFIVFVSLCSIVNYNI